MGCVAPGASVLRESKETEFSPCLLYTTAMKVFRRYAGLPIALRALFVALLSLGAARELSASGSADTHLSARRAQP